MLPSLHTRRASPATDHGLPAVSDPASSAADNRPEQLFEAIFAADEAAVTRLLSSGQLRADAVLGEDGHMALMHAVAIGHAGIVDALLQAGAPANQSAAKGMTALMMAAYHGSVGLAKQLLGKGAEIDAVDHDGLTALMHAAKQGETACALELIDAGASITMRSHHAQNAVDLAADWQHTELARQLPLRAAVRERYVDALPALVTAHVAHPPFAHDKGLLGVCTTSARFTTANASTTLSITPVTAAETAPTVSLTAIPLALQPVPEVSAHAAGPGHATRTAGTSELQNRPAATAVAAASHAPNIETMRLFIADEEEREATTSAVLKVLFFLISSVNGWPFTFKPGLTFKRGE